MGENLGDKAPEIFHVNWFRKDEEGNFMWPGFGDNMRVLLWILDRCEGKVDAKVSAIGFVPNADDIDTTGLDMTKADIEALLTVDKEHWLEDIEDDNTGIRKYFAQFGDRLPKEMADELAKLENNLK